jgi:integrase
LPPLGEDRDGPHENHLMARTPKPYVKDGWFRTSAGGIPHQKLCEVEKGLRHAQIALNRLLIQREDAKNGRAPSVAVPAPADSPAAPGPAVGVEWPTVGQAYNAFMREQQLRVEAGTLAEDTLSWYTDKLEPFGQRFAGRPVNSITYTEGLEYQGWLRKRKEWRKGKQKVVGLKASSANAYVRAAKTFLEWASKPSRRATYGLLSNPWEELEYLPEKGRERLITEEELGHLLTHCKCGNVKDGDIDFQDQLVTLRFTTMRPGELRLLRWEFIRWEDHRVVFPPEVIKTRSRREVTLIDRVEHTLLARRARLGRPAEGFVFPVSGRDERTGKRTAAAGGRHQKANGFSQRFRRLVARCVAKGLIEKEKAGERIVPYSTRHTRITELFVEGHDHAVVMFEAGHKVPATTERYKHLAGSHVGQQIRRRSQQTPSAASGTG